MLGIGLEEFFRSFSNARPYGTLGDPLDQVPLFPAYTLNEIIDGVFGAEFFKFRSDESSGQSSKGV